MSDSDKDNKEDGQHVLDLFSGAGRAGVDLAETGNALRKGLSGRSTPRASVGYPAHGMTGQPSSGTAALPSPGKEGVVAAVKIRARFTQSDVKRALKGAQAAGVSMRMEIDSNGHMHLIPIQPGFQAPKDTLQERIERAQW